MKAQVMTVLLFVSSMLMAASEIAPLNQGRSLVGRVRVGDHRGALCVLTVKDIRNDIYSLRYDTVYSEFVAQNKKWKLNSTLSFPIQNYSGEYMGSSIKSTLHGHKKVVLSLFFDARTNAYKAILHENDIGNDTVSNGKYTVCEGMTQRTGP